MKKDQVTFLFMIFLFFMYAYFFLFNFHFRDNFNFIRFDEAVMNEEEFESTNKFLVQYKVEGDIPEDFVLPDSKSYSPNEKVSINSLREGDVVSGYQFLGWKTNDVEVSSDGEFIMPEHDVLFYGKWVVFQESFDISINLESELLKEDYLIGDVIPVKIILKNNDNFSINNVSVMLEQDNSIFLDSNFYKVLSNDSVIIDTISVGESIELYSNYIVSGREDNTVNYVVNVMNNDVSKQESISLLIPLKSSLEICSKSLGYDNSNSFSFKITGLNSFDTSISLKDGECKKIYLSKDTYRVKEIISQEYRIISVDGDINSNNQELFIDNNHYYQITFIQEYNQKGFYHSSDSLFYKTKGDG